jgi:hypothetical protein
MTCHFRCSCGRIAGEIVDPRDSWHLLCYCRDCRAYAHALGNGAEILDEYGGTHVVGVRPRQLRLLRGAEVLCCLSLTPRGLLRWYAGCCGSALINTPRDPRLPYVGLVHTCLSSSLASLEQSFGPVRYQANKGGATRPPPRLAKAPALALAGLYVALLRGRIGGSWRLTPLFDPTTREPVAKPRILSPEQLGRARELAAA